MSCGIKHVLASALANVANHRGRRDSDWRQKHLQMLVLQTNLIHLRGDRFKPELVGWTVSTEGQVDTLSSTVSESDVSKQGVLRPRHLLLGSAKLLSECK